MTPRHLKFVLSSNFGKTDDSHSRFSVWEHTTKGKSFINTGNITLAWISFWTSSLFISQPNEQLTTHIFFCSSSKCILLFLLSADMRFSLSGEKSGGDWKGAGGRGWEARGLSRELATFLSYSFYLAVFLSWMLQLFWFLCEMGAFLHSGVFKPSQSLSIH